MRTATLFKFFLATICATSARADAGVSSTRPVPVSSNAPASSSAHQGSGFSVTVVKRPPAQSTLVRVGCLLAANSGFMNGLALTGAIVNKNQAVAAVTGAWTTSAVAFAKQDNAALLQQLTALLSYYTGSLINGAMNPFGINWSKAPTTLILSAGLVLGAFVAASNKNLDAKVFWALLTLANGLQNSWTSSLMQGNVLRSAHYSGITSDMGTFTGQILRNNKQNAWKLVIFAKLAASFWMSGAAAYFISQSNLFPAPEYCLLLNVAVYIGLWSFLQS